jgi:pimeloyl-ACP methyl ester carboxylesterase
MPPLKPTLSRLLLSVLFLSLLALPAAAHTHSTQTGFLNREITLNGIAYRYQVFVPWGYDPSSKQRWPVLLFLHGRGERGAEGSWQTQIGIGPQLRDHPDRWPAIVVMPQCPFHHFWTDPEMLTLALSSLDQAESEFHTDPNRTYLAGLSMGGYGAWELLKSHPHRFAAATILSSGIFWSYMPSRWQQQSTLPAQYAARARSTPIWLFHGTEDTTVIPKQSEIMFEALKNANGVVRLWEYIGMHHDPSIWLRAFNEPELPRWLLNHSLATPVIKPYAEKILVPIHPTVAPIPPSTYEAFVGDYYDGNLLEVTIYKEGNKLYQKNSSGEVIELLPENANTYFYPMGGLTRITFEHESGPNSPVKGIEFRDDRREEHWTKRELLTK